MFPLPSQGAAAAPTPGLSADLGPQLLAANPKAPHVAFWQCSNTGDA